MKHIFLVSTHSDSFEEPSWSMYAVSAVSAEMAESQLLENLPKGKSHRLIYGSEFSESGINFDFMGEEFCKMWGQ